MKSRVLRNLIHCWHKHPHLRRWAALFLLACLPACDLTGTKIMHVSGRVTRGGKPVPNLFLNFLPEAGRPSWGVSDDNGYFVLHYDKNRDGAVPGVHTVFVTWKSADPREERLQEGGKLRMPDNLIPIVAKYGNQDSSPIKIDVKNDNLFIKLELD
jgi:hypothetical protein